MGVWTIAAVLAQAASAQTGADLFDGATSGHTQAVFSVAVPAMTGRLVAAPVVDIRAGYAALELGAAQKLSGLDEKQRAALYEATSTNPVAGLDYLDKYDPTGMIGFCFGRAMAAHLLARRLGLADDSVRKLFIIGDMREGADPEWRFHVTALVRGTDGLWYAIDPVMEKPREVNDWIRSVRAIWDKAQKTKLYITHASAVLPDLRVVPDIAKETGAHIIELSFDPTKKPGFAPLSAGFGIAADLKSSVFELDGVANVQRYFLDALGAGENAFDFESITVNGENISYNGYFKDLIADLTNPASPAPARLKALSSPRRIGLGSPRIRPR